MPDRNHCDVYCPNRAVIATEYRQQIRIANPIGITVLGAVSAVKGIVQMNRARTCPQANLPVESWQPAQACVKKASEAICQQAIDTTRLQPFEQSVLQPYIVPPTK